MLTAKRFLPRKSWPDLKAITTPISTYYRSQIFIAPIRIFLRWSGVCISWCLKLWILNLF